MIYYQVIATYKNDMSCDSSNRRRDVIARITMQNAIFKKYDTTR